MVGGLLVAAAAVGTYAAWSGADDPPSTSYVVAAVDLPPGHVLTPGDLALEPIDLPTTLAGRAFTGSAVVVGQVTVAPIVEGELVQRSAVVSPEGASPSRQVSFAIDPADALAGTLEDGEIVDVLVTYGSDLESVTEVVVSGATIASVPDVSDLGSGRTVVLLSLPRDADVLAVTSALRRGDITLIRTTGSGAPPLRPGDRYEPTAPGSAPASG